VIVFVQKHKMLLILLIASLIPAVYIGRPRLNENVIQASFYFFPAYLLGVLLAQNSSIYIKLQNHIAFILPSFILCYLFIAAYFHITKSLDLLFKMSLSILLLGFCYRYLQVKNKALDMFARLSFFLFIIHGYFIGLVNVLIKTLDEYFFFKNFEFLYVVSVFSFVVFSSLLTFIVIKWTFGISSKKWLGI